MKCDQDVLLLNNSLVLERGEIREPGPGNSNITITVHTLLHQIKKSSVAILNCDNHINCEQIKDETIKIIQIIMTSVRSLHSSFHYL